MDLSTLTFDVNVSRKFAVPNPADDWNESDWIIDLLPAESDAVRGAQMQFQKRLIASSASGKKRGKGGSVEIDPKEIKQGNIEMASAAIVGWTGLKNGDEAVDWSADTAKTIISKPSMSWLLDILVDEIGDVADFLGKSKNTSID